MSSTFARPARSTRPSTSRPAISAQRSATSRIQTYARVWASLDQFPTCSTHLRLLRTRLTKRTPRTRFWRRTRPGTSRATTASLRNNLTRSTSATRMIATIRKTMMTRMTGTIAKIMIVKSITMNTRMTMKTDQRLQERPKRARKMMIKRMPAASQTTRTGGADVYSKVRPRKTVRLLKPAIGTTQRTRSTARRKSCLKPSCRTKTCSSSRIRSTLSHLATSISARKNRPRALSLACSCRRAQITRRPRTLRQPRHSAHSPISRQR